jgi:hypothetical protein
LVASFAAGCGDDDEAVEGDDLRQACNGRNVRLVVSGQVGPTAYDRITDDPYDGPIQGRFFDVVLQAGDGAHLMVFTSNVSLDTDLRSALRLRLDSGAQNAAQLETVSRPDDTPCDPRDGVICVFYGVDTNADGLLVGDEVSYPATSGTVTLTAVTGNELAAGYDITFGAQTSGIAEGGGEGGRLTGCFHYQLSTDRQTLF